MITISGLVALCQIIAITHATIVDVEQGASRRDITVIADGPRITAVGPTASIVVPKGARVVEGSGKWLIPGLWDMHVHSAFPSGRAMLALYTANGVTGVRDMGGDFGTISRWRQEIAAGTLVGPRIVASGPYLDGHAPPIPHFEVHTADDARLAVDSLAKLGVDFVKVHSALPRAAFFCRDP